MNLWIWPQAISREIAEGANTLFLAVCDKVWEGERSQKRKSSVFKQNLEKIFATLGLLGWKIKLSFPELSTPKGFQSKKWPKDAASKM